MSLFEIRNLEKTYYGGITPTHVLRGLTFSIESGEFVSIMGPSGSGKSTLLHILGFLAEHTSGEYRFNGKRYEDRTDEQIAKVRNEDMGFVFQSFNLLPRQSIYENVALPLLYSTVPKAAQDAKIKEVIKLVGMDHRMEYETYKLSGGEKQRVAIARALVNNPSVIFADEPTGNLDSHSGQIVMETLQHLHDVYGHTVVLITHETFTAEHANRIIHIVDGKITKDEKLKRRREASRGFVK